MKPIDLVTAKEIIDFSGGQASLENLAQIQLKGAVALYNMIADRDVGMGYLADEVGMGKTYIALGVVTLMRYFNPSLRVLYICPSRNVQEKWHREYLSFTKYNVVVNQFRIRTVDGKPAAPYINCSNVNEMIAMASSGYYADFFVGKDSFSISLANDESDDQSYWRGKCESIRDLVPAHQWDGIIKDKLTVKEQYAKALNYVLPTFDLVVIDEAHNFKHGFESSDRNKVLSRVLGFYDTDHYQPRVKNALLLSATPYDRDLTQLRNQLNLIGKSDLLPAIEHLKPDGAVQYLKKFMVRRLNELPILGQPHTRNMYRKEHRTGQKAEINLVSDEQKLVTALVQKKVSEALGKKGDSPSFQTGMLASFESYSQTAKAELVQFDGEAENKIENDAKDRQLIDILSSSYKESGLGRTLPHPKMDQISRQLAKEIFEEGRKQLVFVRRVKSVGELKEKLDELYNQWLKQYISNYLSDAAELAALFEQLFAEYFRQSQSKDGDISEGIYTTGGEDEAEDQQPPKNDTFFAWFFRGQVAPRASELLGGHADKLTTPDLLRRGLTAKNQKLSLLMELNWTQYICDVENKDLDEIINQHIKTIAEYANQFSAAARSVIDVHDAYRASQLGFLRWYSESLGTDKFEPLLKHLQAEAKPAQDRSVLLNEEVCDYLKFDTLYTEIRRQGLSETLFPLQNTVYQELLEGKDGAKATIEKMDVHQHLISVCLRTGHGIIDLYLHRIKRGSDSFSDESRRDWIKDFVAELKSQNETGFSTYKELTLLSEQLDLIIKTNVPKALEISKSERRRYLSRELNPIAPIIGATGETYGIRSAQARKFRMPGYPMALVSTDVFQEGEDLHTFCDSVVHYGLSGSPISIEQKTGRVDRVNSMAQRRLLSYKAQQLEASALIQVVFPYVKESIELLQVRQLCRNVNEFIKSLHEIGGSKVNILDLVEAETALQDQSEIPEQIMNLLRSPYDVDVVTELEDAGKQEQGEKAKKTEEIVQHIASLVNGYCNSDAFNRGQWKHPESGVDIVIKLTSARATGLPILSLTCLDDEYFVSEASLSENMLRRSWKTLHRVQAKELANGRYHLLKNCELMVGDVNVTQPEDVRDLFERIQTDYQPRFAYPTSHKVIDYCNRMAKEGIKDSNRLSILRAELVNEYQKIGIKFNFGIDYLNRQHTVWVYEDNDYCVFITKAVSAQKIKQIKKDRDNKIIRHTWLRNKKIDVVEFMLDPDEGISGRVVHPINSLDWDEFSYSAYMLAVEADRLEYIFDKEDYF